MKVLEKYSALNPELTLVSLADVLIDALVSECYYGPIQLETIPELVETILDQLAEEA